MNWDNWDDADRRSNSAAVRMLNPEILAKGPYAILTVGDYENKVPEAQQFKLCDDNLFKPGENIVWFQNFNLDFIWAFMRNPAMVRFSSPAIQLIKIVGRPHRKDTRAWFQTTHPHAEVWDQPANMIGEMHFNVHAGKMWSLKTVAFDSVGQIIIIEFKHRLMLNHMVKMDTVPPELSRALETRFGRR
jgi:hypothetical protein